MKKILISLLIILSRYSICLDICHIYTNDCLSFINKNNEYEIDCLEVKCQGETR